MIYDTFAGVYFSFLAKKHPQGTILSFNNYGVHLTVAAIKDIKLA